MLHAAERLRAAGDALAGLVAVVPSLDAPVAAVLRGAGVPLVEARDAAHGLAHSLRAGLAAAAAHHLAPGAALVALGDQPAVSPAAIAALVARWRAGGALALRPRYADDPDTPGHPVLLDRAAWALAHDLSGDRGLRDLLAAVPGGVALVDVPGRNPDVDTRADLAALHLPETERCD